jgi:GNAT superfamily N-acetyltransferase
MRDALNRLELAGCPHAAIQRLSVEEFTTLWGGTLTDPDYCWRIVEGDEQPRGFGLIFLLPPKVPPLGAYVQWAYMAPPYRRQGLGRLLLDHLVNWAHSRQVSRIELQFIEGNEAAERFWTKMGFQPFARKCVHYLSGRQTTDEHG